jgi:phosphatidylserine synthase
MQTLWFLITATLAFTSLKTSFFSGNKLILNAQSSVNEKLFISLTGMSHMLIMILTVGIGILCLVTIFFYKNRKTQIKMSFAALAVSLLTIVLYFLQTKTFVPSEGSYDLTALIVFCSPLFLIMAIMGIYKDEKLIKRADRLR